MRDLNDLHLYAAVVSHGGFSAAARALQVPKSRISRRVAALEAELGVRLVERSTRRFQVTEVGQEVYRHARAALGEAEAVAEAALRHMGEPHGLVRLSCPVGVDRLLSTALPGFLARHPHLRVQLLVTNRRVDLIGEGIDLAIRSNQRMDADAELQVRVLDRPFTVLVASPAFIAAHGAPQHPDELNAYPTICYTDRPGLQQWPLTHKDGQEVTVSHEPRLAASSVPPLRQAALDGVGIALLQIYSCREDLEEGRLVRVLPDWRSLDVIIHLVFTSRRGVLPGVRAAMDFVIELFESATTEWRRVG